VWRGIGSEGETVRKLRQRIERAGFFIFFLGLILAAIGISQGVAVLWILGLVILGLVVLTVIVRATRAVSGPPRRSRPPHETKPRGK
jgi:hypothetical protein